MTFSDYANKRGLTPNKTLSKYLTARPDVAADLLESAKLGYDYTELAEWLKDEHDITTTRDTVGGWVRRHAG